jgi:hypothetical protein
VDIAPLAIAIIAVAAFWVGLIVGVQIDDWVRKENENEDQDGE